MKASSLKTLGKIFHWLLLIIVALYIITGLGILYANILPAPAAKLEIKNLGFRIHSNLIIPFVAVLAGHIWTSAGRKE